MDLNFVSHYWKFAATFVYLCPGNRDCIKLINETEAVLVDQICNKLFDAEARRKAQIAPRRKKYVQ